MKTRASCLKVVNSVILSIKTLKCFHLDEFQQTQQQSITKIKKFLTHDWVPQIGCDLRAFLANVQKGWFNLDETDREAFNMCKFFNFLNLVSSMMIDSARHSVMLTYRQFDLYVKDLTPESAIITSSQVITSKFEKHSNGAMVDYLFEIDISAEGETNSYYFDSFRFRSTLINLFSRVVDSVRSIPIIEPKFLPDMFRNVV